MQSRDVRWLGALFVLSAGFAREYDGEYLLADWWYLVIPLVASLVGSFALTLLVWVTAWIRGVRTVGLLTTYGTILNAYWMTAPLAWLYAIPVERMLGEVDAVRANLCLLGLVSIWRVTLMLRSLKILYGCRYWEALMPTMVFSLIVGYIAILMLPVPLFVVMGGVRIPQSEEIIVATRLQITLAAVMSSPVWVIGLLVVWFIRKRWVWSLPTDDRYASSRVSPVAYSVGVLSLLIWLPVLPRTQAEQYQKWQAEQMLKSANYRGLAEWSHSVSEKDLPPHWIPPPRLTYGYADLKTIEQTTYLLQEDLADWYSQQCLDTLKENLRAMFSTSAFANCDPEILRGLIRLKEHGKLDEEITKTLSDRLKWDLRSEHLDFSDENRALLEEIHSWQNKK